MAEQGLGLRGPQGLPEPHPAWRGDNRRLEQACQEPGGGDWPQIGTSPQPEGGVLSVCLPPPTWDGGRGRGFKCCDTRAFCQSCSTGTLCLMGSEMWFPLFNKRSYST